MPVLSGVDALDVDGVLFNVDTESTTWGVQTRTHEVMVNDNGPIGRKRAGRAPFIATKIYFEDSQLATDLNGKVDIPVTLRLPDRIVRLTDAIVVGDVDIDANENSATVRFEGLQGTETSI